MTDDPSLERDATTKDSKAKEFHRLERERGFLQLRASEAGALPVSGDSLLPEAQWYEAGEPGDGLTFDVPLGALAQARYITFDMLLAGDELAVFQLALEEETTNRRFVVNFGLLNWVQARVRLPVGAVDQNRWRFEREGAWLKPICGGDRVDPAQVSRMTLSLLRRGDKPVKWLQTKARLTSYEPDRLKEPLLPKGPLIDELGQSALRNWSEKSRSSDQVSERLRRQLKESTAASWPLSFSRWGGDKSLQFEANGFFQTHHDGTRWWFVDPEGGAFWSSGVNCVRVDTEASYGGLETALKWMPDREGAYAAAHEGRPDLPSVNYLAANFIRAFGPNTWYENWSKIALAEMKRLGFNTVANWSDWPIAKASGFPYVRTLHLRLEKTPKVYRDFPDVFHPNFSLEAEETARQLESTADDPALIGYFLMNEPTWGFAKENPAAGMLYATEACACRDALKAHLTERYRDDRTLASAWGMDITLEDVARGRWEKPLTEQAQLDLEAFSEVMVDRFFGELTKACRRVDPHHLNLGVRYYTVPPEWALKAMGHFDVFSMNCYRETVPQEALQKVTQSIDRPVLIGEWHFGALDVGLPASGIGRVKDQAARGEAMRRYIEEAAALPECVGVHYFTLYDQSALGRFDGENYNIGFLDVCNREYEEPAQAVRKSHERLYQVARGIAAPYVGNVEYLPRLFI